MESTPCGDSAVMAMEYTPCEDFYAMNKKVSRTGRHNKEKMIRRIRCGISKDAIPYSFSVSVFIRPETELTP